ncbi:Endonuclease/exonuclease/phosphatase, partial [Trametes maxima]
SKARLRIATLNMRGYSGSGEGSGTAKWMLINQLARDEKVAVLALQETHLSNERLAELNRLFGPQLEVVASQDPENELGARGVAFAINRRVLKDAVVRFGVVVPGRAATLQIQWSETRTLKVMNVYGPNVQSDGEAFWVELNRSRLGRIDLMVGDFNVVEEATDRLPAREDASRNVNALDTLKKKLRVRDGWRTANPQKRAFTYFQAATGSQSRIDRIYIREEMLNDADEWDIRESGIRTDHCMASVTIEDYKAPFVGKGRWAMPMHLLRDEVATKEMRRLGEELVRNINEQNERTERENPQTQFQNFKLKLVAMLRKRAREKIPKMQKRIDKMATRLEEILNTNKNSDRMEDEERVRKAAELKNKIADLSQKRFGWRKNDVAAKHWARSETMTKYWTRTS